MLSLRKCFIGLSLTGLLLVLSNGSIAQVVNPATLDTTGGARIKDLTIGAYIDLYYGFSFDEPSDHVVPYMTNSNYANEVNVNLAFIDVRYQTKRLRARFVPGFGTYINANYASETGSLKNLVEANAGILLHKEKNIWFDFGVLGSPYTNESAISRDHLMYTRSLGTEYVPYYLAGGKFTVPLGVKTNFYVYVLNGWQQIHDQNNGKSIGTQIEFRPNDKHLINWNTYVGDERSAFANTYRMRYFSDVYWVFTNGKKIKSTVCASAGMQEQKNSFNVRSNHFWWASSLILSYNFTEKLSLAGRLETYSDPNKLMINTLSTEDGFVGASGGLCLNYKFNDNSLLRLEGREFVTTADQFLTKDNEHINTLPWVIGNLTVWF